MPLVLVEEAFTARGPGVLVRPAIDASLVPSGPFDVIVRTPDGAERRARATVDVPHVRGPMTPKVMVRVHDVTVADLPSGTTIALAE